MHNIAQTDEGEWMTAWAGNTPWHGLGTSASSLMTTQEALTAAHLDWQVEKLPLRYFDKGLIGTLPNTFGVFRNDGEQLVPLTRNGKAVGKVWKALQNIDGFSWLDELMQNQEAKIEVCGALGHGEKVWVLARLPKNITFNGIDVVHQYILISNSHDGTGSVRILPTPIRVVCGNTLAMALSQGAGTGYSVRHTAKLHDRMEEVRVALEMVDTDFETWAVEAEELINTKMNKNGVEEYFIDVLNLKRDEKGNLATRGQGMLGEVFELLDSPNNKVGKMEGTAWAAYNAVTEYIDYNATTLRDGSKSVKRMESALFGPLARRKVKAWNAAMELVA